MIKQNFKLLFKSLHISIPIGLLLIYYIGNLIYGIYSYSLNGDVLFYLQTPLEACFISFIVLLYASYEFFYLFKLSLADETLFSHKNGKARIYFSGTAVLSIIPALEFILAFAFNFIIFNLSGMTDTNYLMHIIFVLFLYTFLGGIIPVLLGIIIGGKFKRIVSYAFIALIIFIVSSASDFLPGSLSQMTFINFWKLKYFFTYFLPNDLDFFVNYDYGMYLEPYRWNLTLFWIFLFLFMVFVSCSIKNKQIKITAFVITIALSLTNLSGYFIGGSHIEKGPELDSISMSDYVYYKNHKKLNEEPNFQVKSYNMDLSINRELSAEVKTTLSNSNLKKYKFTLYHGYNITEITDNNDRKLNYERKGDYVTVDNLYDSSALKFKYSGYSSVLYSNYQACSLPGFFPYYPIAGFYDFVNDFGTFTPVCNLPKADFSVKINSLKPIYTNLNKVSGNENSFDGYTNCPMLFSGFYEKCESEKYHIYKITVKGWGLSSFTENDLDSLQSHLTKLESSENDSVNLEDYIIIQLNDTVLNSCLGGYAFLGDNVILLPNITDEETKQQVAESLIQQKALGYSQFAEKQNNVTIEKISE